MNGTFPSWDEWDGQLTEDQRKYSTYKILQSVEIRLSEGDAEIKKLKNRKVKDGGLAALFGTAAGFIAGFIK